MRKSCLVRREEGRYIYQTDGTFVAKLAEAAANSGSLSAPGSSFSSRLLLLSLMAGLGVHDEVASIITAKKPSQFCVKIRSKLAAGEHGVARRGTVYTQSDPCRWEFGVETKYILGS